MNKLFTQVLHRLRKSVAIVSCLSASFLTIGVEDAAAQGCYAFRLASNGKYLTNTNGLRVQPANNQANQIFRLEPAGEYVRITPNGTQYAGQDALTRRWDDAVVASFLYSGSDGQLWKQKSIASPAGSYGFIQKNSDKGFGSTLNWGDGDPNAASDINMVPAGDVDIYGGNKWFLEPKTCPLSAGVCDFNITLNASTTTPNVNANFTLTANCSGGGCSGVTYEWAAQGMETSIYGSPQVVSMPNPGIVDYTVIATKNGCGTRSAHVRVYVQSGNNTPNFSQCIESENSNGNGTITQDPNASNGSTRGDEFNYNRYVDYVVNNVPSAGSYNVKFRYYAPSESNITVSVASSGFSQTRQIPRSNSWNIVWREENLSVNLSAGTNTIRIQGVGGGSVRQDNICVTNGAGGRMGVTEAVLENETGRELQVYPNPSKGEFEVAFYLEKGEPADLTVTSIAGKTVQKRGVIGKGLHHESFDLTGQPAGMYLFNVIKHNQIEVKKILINN
jgi:hypothetical protein